MNLRQTCALFGVITAAFAWRPVAGQQQPPPILDVHMHAFRAQFMGPEPVALCPGWVPGFAEAGRPWVDTFLNAMKHPPCANPITSPMTDREMMDRTFQIMKRRNVIGVFSGPMTKPWQQAFPDRVIPSLSLFITDGPQMPPDTMRAAFADGQFRALGEVGILVQGIEPSDPAFDTYLTLAEELDIPVSVHVGPETPGAPYLGATKFRARLHSPLLFEEALLKHPRLRLSLMHAGWPMLDELLAVMWNHPQLYVDVAILDFGLPRPAFHEYLRRIVEAGFGERVMFGSDQMGWPDALEIAIQAIESASFLSAHQKRDIFYNNAARFLKLTDAEIARHHGR
jgi:uncharacterized protein